MANLSLRGLDTQVLAGIKTHARRRKVSVNRAIIDILTKHFGSAERTFNDLDALAGTWSKAEAVEFENAIAPFGEVDRTLWVAEPRSAYPARPRRAGKSRTGAVRK
jgi:hypothetical protein